jgi:hypothetical protein
MAGRVKARRQPHEAWSWAAQGGRGWQDLAAVQLGSSNMGWERELIGGAHASVRGERLGVGPMRGMYSVKYTKGAGGLSGPMRGMTAYE